MVVAESLNAHQLHIRISRQLPRELSRALHPKALDELCGMAFENGWRDADWLTNYALEGTAHPSVENAAAVFVHRLKDICATPCPLERTPQPPAIDTVLAEINQGHQPSTDPAKHVQEIRRTLGASA